MSNFLLLAYTYRDADNYKTSLSVAVPGDVDKKGADRLYDRLASDEGFVPGQIGLPDLQINFNEGMTFWDDERDHPFHEIYEVAPADTLPAGTMVLNSMTARDLAEAVEAIPSWDAGYRPDFHGAMAALKADYDRDPDAFMAKVLEKIGGRTR